VSTRVGLPPLRTATFFSGRVAPLHDAKYGAATRTPLCHMTMPLVLRSGSRHSASEDWPSAKAPFSRLSVPYVCMYKMPVPQLICLPHLSANNRPTPQTLCWYALLPSQFLLACAISEQMPRHEGITLCKYLGTRNIASVDVHLSSSISVRTLFEPRAPPRISSP
jgi:hypothetical protein